MIFACIFCKDVQRDYKTEDVECYRLHLQRIHLGRYAGCHFCVKNDFTTIRGISMHLKNMHNVSSKAQVEIKVNLEKAVKFLLTNGYALPFYDENRILVNANAYNAEQLAFLQLYTELSSRPELTSMRAPVVGNPANVLDEETSGSIVSNNSAAVLRRETLGSIASPVHTDEISQPSTSGVSTHFSDVSTGNPPGIYERVAILEKELAALKKVTVVEQIGAEGIPDTEIGPIEIVPNTTPIITDRSESTSIFHSIDPHTQDIVFKEGTTLKQILASKELHFPMFMHLNRLPGIDVTVTEATRTFTVTYDEGLFPALPVVSFFSYIFHICFLCCCFYLYLDVNQKCFRRERQHRWRHG